MRLLLVFIYLSLHSISCKADQDAKASSRKGVWLTNVASNAMSSQENIEEALEICKNAGFNTIYPVVWHDGYTLYPSELMSYHFDKSIHPDFINRDPLNEIIAMAKRLDLEVIPWFEFGFSCSLDQEDGGHIIRQYPHWAAIDKTGKLVSKNGFQWMNPFDPQVQNFMTSLVLEVVTKYDVDGIQGDDRFPACPSSSGYDDNTIAKYLKENSNLTRPKEDKEPNWLNWRVDRLNEFMRNLSKSIKEADPSITISMAPSIYPWSKNEYLQDWPTWINDDLIDEVCPQIYRKDKTAYHNELAKIVREQVAEDKIIKVFPGILGRVGDYYADTSLIHDFVVENRTAGITGEVYFYYEAVLKNPDFFKKMNEL